jgi:hypothetical protein
MAHQSSLFSEEAPGTAAESTATVTQSSTALCALKFSAGALSAEQQAFNRLLTRTENLSRKIAAAQSLADAHRTVRMSTLRPLEIERDQLMRGMVLWLAERLTRKNLSVKQQRIAREIICNLATEFALMGDEEMRALHDAHSDTSLTEKEKAIAADTRAFVEDILGEPLDSEREFADLEEMLQAGMEHVHKQSQAREQARAARKGRHAKSARQQRTQQQALDADSALRTLYRQLVSALHPDRESDPHERLRKTTLMSEANTAYAKRDLLALLHLQLRADLADGEMVSNLARGKLAALSVLLKERATVLSLELREIERRTMLEFELPPDMTLSAPNLKRDLLEQQQDLQAEIAMMKRDFRRVQDDAGLKRWLSEQHNLARNEARIAAWNFDIPF